MVNGIYKIIVHIIKDINETGIYVGTLAKNN